MALSEEVRTRQQDSPYPGPRPFERGDEGNFFGQLEESSELGYLVTAHPTVLLYAQSGAGKTSLLNAGLKPIFKERGFDVLPPARVGSPIPPSVSPIDIANIFVYSAISSWLAREDGCSEINDAPVWLPCATLADGLNHIPHKLDEVQEPATRILIFDQFEEIFYASAERWLERHAFFEQVAAALQADINLRVLFSIREEYLAAFDAEATTLPEAVRTRFRLERLSRSAALAAVVGPLGATNVKFDHGVAETLVDDLLKVQVEDVQGKSVTVAGAFVEPVQLQLICQNLFDHIPLSSNVITMEHLRAFGNADETLRDFYQEALLEAARKTWVSEAKLRAWFEHELITPSLTRGTVFRGAAKTGGISNEAVVLFEARHLIRAEYRSGARWYELTHDRFIRPILNSNSVWQSQRRRRKNFLVYSLVVVAFMAVTAAILGYSRLSQKSNQIAELNQANNQLATQASQLSKDLTQSDIRLALTQLKAGDEKLASNTVRFAWQRDPLATLTEIERFKNSAQANTSLQKATLRLWRDLLKSSASQMSANSQLREYVCKHNLFVIGVSERPSAAKRGLALAQRHFPNAELGRQSNNFIPIIIDSFLTCSEAAARVHEANGLWAKGAYASDWYSGCGGCPDLPSVHRPFLLKP